MRVRGILVLLLLLALAGPVSAVPLLPAEFWGTVTIDGSPAPAGTVITARINGSDCGSLTLTTDGIYGGNALFDARLLVNGEDGDDGKTIVFLVDGVLAPETTVYAHGTSTRLDLTAAAPEGAAFSANVTAGPAPLTVRFTGESNGDPVLWSWSFGDGGTSTGQNPTHTYVLPGNYTVTLSVDGGLSTTTRPEYIKVTPVLFGDANEDGRVNQADTLLVLQEVLGIREQPAAGTDRFRKTDVHVNGAVEVGDALFIAQYNIGLRDPWFALL